MAWSKTFKAQNYNQPTLKHHSLPVYITKEFDFYRCIEFDAKFYGKTVSELHKGNLRICDGRYAKLFPNQKISYWADSPKTARAEVKIHGASNNQILFWAYDDTSSFIPTTENEDGLIIIDGRKCGVQALIDKLDNEETISSKEQIIVQEILACEPDALAYDSHALPSGENFIFFEKGFKKLSLRQVSLRLGDRNPVAKNKIVCAGSSDYMPYIKEYGKCFNSIVRIGFDGSYLNSKEYNTRLMCYNKSFQQK